VNVNQAPFKGDDEEEIFHSILHIQPVYPSHLDRTAVNLIQRLLCSDPKKRLGATKNDAEEIKKHAFFANIDWEGILTKKVKPPFVPKIVSLMINCLK
jgi:serine/threonine protein kinase